jgi:hypothetical protein
MNVFNEVSEFVCMTEARVQERNFLSKCKLESDRYGGFVKAYNI